MNYKPVIGLEVHVELRTDRKMFCACPADYFGQKPNTHTCPVCLGLPGALPVPNRVANEWCIMIALALNCKINKISKFDRKNYFYPDLPKGYQISQYDLPFGYAGEIYIKAGENSADNDKKIGITRVHMEEDTGKLLHPDKTSLIDFNRSGVPLVEIVTEPDFENAYQVTQYLQKLQQIVRYLGVSNADMEKGQMRLEPNISLQRVGETELPGYKVEVKNINSFRFVSRAIETEIKRQAEILDRDEQPIQETRGWNEAKNTTVSQRSKEEAQDYRYFPEPDIPPIITTTDEIAAIRTVIPELPDEKKKRFVDNYSLSEYIAEILTRDRGTANYFEEAAELCLVHNLSAKQIANHIINKKSDLDKLSPNDLVEQVAKVETKEEVEEDVLNKTIEQVISENPQVVEEYKSGKIQVIGFLIGKTRQKLPQNTDASNLKDAIEQALK